MRSEMTLFSYTRTLRKNSSRMPTARIISGIGFLSFHSGDCLPDDALPSTTGSKTYNNS